MSDSVLIPKDEWMKKRGFSLMGATAFDKLWGEYEIQTEALLRMQRAVLERPITATEIKERERLFFANEVALSTVNKGEYEDGLMCERSGKNTESMERCELIAFIGMLDGLATDRQHGLDKAIELLEACTEDLFIEGCDKQLEDAVDKFLSENSKCSTNCTECKNCPTSLKEQAV